jgi:DNA-directed RNA polymerase subunit RPC12/RpoP
MGSRDQTPAHEITPPAFLAEHLDEFDAEVDDVEDVSVDQLAEALRSAERQRSTTPDSQRPRCPECGSLELRIKPGGVQNDAERVDTPYRCEACGEHVHAVTVDETDATALATDGGRRRRWSAFGGD